MKTLNSLFVLMIGLSSLMATAQKADSVIVIYDNQKTVIPVPAFGSQTTIKMADSIQIIEIGVSRKIAGINFPVALQTADQDMLDNNSEKVKKQVKWFSQIEAAYTKSFTEQSFWGNSSSTNEYGIPVNIVFNNYVSNINGYKLRLLLRENITMLNEKLSYNSGFKIGFAQTFNNESSTINIYDNTGNLLSDTSHFYNFRSSSIHIVFDAGFAFHFQAFNSYSRIFIGNSFSYIIEGRKDLNDKVRTSSYVIAYSSLIQPYIGTEIGKYGLMISLDFGNPNNGQFPLNPGNISPFNYSPTLSTGLTFRLF